MDIKIFTPKVILICSIIVLASKSFAQNYQLEGFTGMTLGIIKEKLEDNNVQSSSISRQSRIPNLGMLIAAGIGRSTMIETGLLYSPRGARVFGGNWKLDFIDLPASLVIQPENFRIFFGPQISFLIKSEVEGLNTIEIIERTDFGLRYGFGLEIPRLTLRLVFQNGLFDILKDPGYRWKSNSIAINIGYVIKKRNRSIYEQEDPMRRHRTLD